MLVDRKQMDLYEKQTKEKTEGDSEIREWAGEVPSLELSDTKDKNAWGVGRTLSECLFNSLNSDL